MKNSSLLHSVRDHVEDETLTKIGKYLVVKEVGRGSTGVVYLSHDPYYRRDVAIKVYNIDTSDDERAKVSRKMFMSEAHMVGMLQHCCLTQRIHNILLSVRNSMLHNIYYSL